MSTRTPDLGRSRRDLRRWLEQHWRLSLVEGIVLMLLGAAAVLLPGVAAFAIEALLGWLLVLAGLTGFATSWTMRGAAGAGWSFGSAALALGCGALLIYSPLGGVLTLTALVAGFLVLESAFSLMLALASKRVGAGRWTWLATSAVVDLVLAAMIVVGYPGSARWALGLLVGCNLVCGGAALIAMAVFARHPASVGPSPPSARPTGPLPV